MDLLEMIQKRLDAYKALEKLRNTIKEENRSFTAEERVQWDASNADFDNYSGQIDATQRFDDLGKVLDNGAVLDVAPPAASAAASGAPRETKVTNEHRATALAAWMRAGRDMDTRAKEACHLTGIDPGAKNLDLSFRTGDYARVKRELRADVNWNVQATSGLETIPEGFMNNLEASMLAFGSVRNVATVIRTDTGNALPWPTTNDTGNAGVLLAEETTIGESLAPAFSAVTFNAYKYSSKLIKVSPEIIQDSAFDLPSVLGRLLGERLARATEAHFTTGTGTAQPRGIVTAAGEVNTATDNVFAVGDVFTLFHSVDPAYRNGPGVGWMAHDSIIKTIRLFTEAVNGQYLWQPGLQAGVPDMIFGSPVYANQSMASAVADDADILLFGMLSKYVIRDVSGIRLSRLTERYADTDQEGFIAFSRHDGDLLDAGTDPVKVLNVL